MLPVVRGNDVTKKYILVYALAMLPISLLLYFVNAVGRGYLVAATVLGLIFLALSVLNVKPSAGDRQAKQLFFYSMAYLTVLFAAMVVDCQCR
jgi:protoheme IX farnesyltransferase